MRTVLAVLFALAAAPIAAAGDGRWTLVQVLGEVSVEEPGVAQIAVKPSARLSEGVTLTTGPSGRAILTDGRSSITVNANSRIELPAAGGENVTSIRQDFGTAIFKVQKKPTAHFEVQTPYLAAVVKGTTFEVTVDAMGASVDVEEGLVDVGANISGERTLVPGGQRVRVLRSGRFDSDRPADKRPDRQTVAALNVISVEIAPEAVDNPGQEREFASLQPQFDRQETRDDRTFTMDRDNDEGSSRATPPAGAPSDGGGSVIQPPEPLPQPPLPIESGTSGGGSNSGPSGGGANSGPSRDDDHGDVDRDNDRRRWATFVERLKQAYLDWKAREGSDSERHSWDRDDD